MAAVGATALVTGLVTYFTFRPSAANVNSGATAEIRNDVNIEENIGRDSELLSILGVMILGIIALVKITELIIYFVNRCKQSIKKKYGNRANDFPLTTQPTAAPVSAV